MDAASHRRLKANRKIAGRPCAVCAAPFVMGEDVAVCTACAREHHAACWDGHRGCVGPGCLNAPLRQLEGLPAPEEQVAEGMERCPRCGSETTAGEALCVWCHAVLSPDGIYHGPKRLAPGARASVVWGAIGILFFGIFIGPHAMRLAREAKALMAQDPRYEGAGWASAGYVLGVLDIVVFVIGIFSRIAK